MSVMGDKNIDKRGGKAKKGRFDGLSRAGSSGEAELDGLDASVLLATVLAVVRGGGAIMFGLTSDGGALCITLLDGGERHKEYLHTSEEISWFLEAVRVNYDGV